MSKQVTQTQEADQLRPLELAESEEERLARLEAVIYAADDPPTLQQLVNGLGLDSKSVRKDIETLLQSYSAKSRGIEIRAVGGGYQMFTKAEHHEVVSAFVKSSRPKLKLSKPAVETLAVVAYRQPVTLPEIQAIRGVNTTGVIHTLLNHKLIATAGRKKIIGRPIQYKTTKEFLIQFGLNDLSELPSQKEMQELARAAIGEDHVVQEQLELGQVAVESTADNEGSVDTDSSTSNA